MNEYETSIFNGRCPYTDKPCLDKIPCNRCRANEEEKQLVQEMDKQEQLEIWLEEMAESEES